MRRMMLGQATLLAASLSIGAVAVRRDDEGEGGAGQYPPMEVLVVDERPPVPVSGETRQQRRARERREAKATRRKSK